MSTQQVTTLQMPCSHRHSARLPIATVISTSGAPLVRKSDSVGQPLTPFVSLLPPAAIQPRPAPNAFLLPPAPRQSWWLHGAGQTSSCRACIQAAHAHPTSSGPGPKPPFRHCLGPGQLASSWLCLAMSMSSCWMRMYSSRNTLDSSVLSPPVRCCSLQVAEGVRLPPSLGACGGLAGRIVSWLGCSQI